MELTVAETFWQPSLNLNYWNGWPMNAVNPDNTIFAYSSTSVSVPSSFQMIPGGGLRIMGQKIPYGKYAWTTGTLTNFGSFSQKYGHFEMTAKVPKGNGLWPAFWLLPDNYSWPPEIDIMEVLGQDPLHPFFSLHTGTTNVNQSLTVSTVDLSQDCHTYSIDWLPGSLTWSLDGVQVYAVTGASVPSQPMYMIMNLGVSGAGSWAKSPDASTPVVNSMDIYSVYAYKLLNQVYDREPLTFGKTTLSSYNVSAGATIHLTSSIKVGKIAPGYSSFQVMVNGYGNSYALPAPILTSGVPQANSIFPLKADIQLPASIPPGLYNVHIKLLAYGSGNYPEVPTAAMFTVNP